METSHFFRTFLAMTRVVDFSWLFLRFHFQWTVGNMAMTCSGIVVLAAKHLLETAPNLWRLQHRGGVLTPSVAGWINGSIGFLKSRRHVFDSFSSTFLAFLAFFWGHRSLTSFTGEMDLSPVSICLSTFGRWHLLIGAAHQKRYQVQTWRQIKRSMGGLQDDFFLDFWDWKDE